MSNYQVVYELSTGAVKYFTYQVGPGDEMTIDDIARDYADSVSAVVLGIYELPATYTVTLDTRRGDIRDLQITCASETDACWQAYEIARRHDAKLINVSR